jgi:predicted GTPase
VVAGKKVLIVEDGPTITHGGMPHGAGFRAVKAMADVTIVDPHESAAPDIARLYEQYPHIGPVLPAAGYGDEQRAALAATINASAAEIVVAATPVDLAAILAIDKPVVRAHYDYADLEQPGLAGIVDDFLLSHAL